MEAPKGKNGEAKDDMSRNSSGKNDARECELAGSPECAGIVVRPVPGAIIQCLRELCVHPLRHEMAAPLRGVHNTAGNVNPHLEIGHSLKEVDE